MAPEEQERLLPDDEISWLALEIGTRVLTSDGKMLGHVTHVLGDLSEDIFDGIGLRHGLLGQILIPRSAIARITRGAVHLAVAESEVAKVTEAYSEERIYSAREGRKKLRWHEDEDEERY